jgi:citrate synthase
MLVRDLMSSPVITCKPEASLADAARTMAGAEVGSVIVSDASGVRGILTERDLLRAASLGVDPDSELVSRWMTSKPDVLGPDEDVGRLLADWTRRPYRHLPVVQQGSVVGVVSLRDLLPGRTGSADELAPPGLEGVLVAETALGDVRGREGFYHYRQYSAVDLAKVRSFEDVWFLFREGSHPNPAEEKRFASETGALRQVPTGLAQLLPAIAERSAPLDALRTAVSLLGSELGWRPVVDDGDATLRAQTLQLGAVIPSIIATAYRLRLGLAVVPPRTDLSLASNYLWMLTGVEPDPIRARAIEQYLILTIDHGFNTSTFTSRVIVSTQADLAAAICGAIGALSGPLHGGAPSRALDMLDAIGTVDRAEAWIRDAVSRNERLPGFGHRVYKTQDPRSTFLREIALELGGPLVDYASEVEQTVVRILAELKPGRELYTNVEFYAGVVMETCGIPREMFTPTFAISRAAGWTAHVMEQVANNRLIRPAARYVGPPPPERVPPRQSVPPARDL